jgi:glycosyltransferase involved in cell wall biosynthesis
MRVIILAETYSRKMGYAWACLPKALARLGVDVHVVTPGLPPYYRMPYFEEAYGAFLEKEERTGVEQVDGYQVHYVPHRKQFGYVRMTDLGARLSSLRPDVVQTFVAISWIPLDAARARIRLRFKLFTGNHTTASSFPLARRKSGTIDAEWVQCLLTRAIPGRFASMLTEKCYAVTPDAADIAVRFFGVQKSKVEVAHLGVDTDIFFPATSEKPVEERDILRRDLGVGIDDVLCVYSGRMTAAKNPLILAEAIAQLRGMGKRYIGLFIGDGVQREAIYSAAGSILRPFMPFEQLAPYYRAADIGVWPVEESTSILDAAACGIPIIVSDRIYREPAEGNGLVYRANDVDDLVRSLLALRNREDRERLGGAGAKKMAQSWSWDCVARRRLADYEAALRARTSRSLGEATLDSDGQFAHDA